MCCREEYDRYYRGAAAPPPEDYYRKKEDPYRDSFRDPWNGRRDPESMCCQYKAFTQNDNEMHSLANDALRAQMSCSIDLHPNMHPSPVHVFGLAMKNLIPFSDLPHPPSTNNKRLSLGSLNIHSEMASTCLHVKCKTPRLTFSHNECLSNGYHQAIISQSIFLISLHRVFFLLAG